MFLSVSVSVFGSNSEMQICKEKLILKIYFMFLLFLSCPLYVFLYIYAVYGQIDLVLFYPALAFSLFPPNINGGIVDRMGKS